MIFEENKIRNKPWTFPQYHLKCHATKRILPWMAQVTKLTSNFRCCLGRDRILSIKKRTNILIVKRGIRRMWKFEELISKKKNARGIAVGMLSFPAFKNQLLLKFCNLSVKAFNILFADKTN